MLSLNRDYVLFKILNFFSRTMFSFKKGFPIQSGMKCDGLRVWRFEVYFTKKYVGASALSVALKFLVEVVSKSFSLMIFIDHYPIYVTVIGELCL